MKDKTFTSHYLSQSLSRRTFEQLLRGLAKFTVYAIPFCFLFLPAHHATAQFNGFTNRFNYSDGTTYGAAQSRRDMGDSDYWLRPENSRVYDGNLRIKFDQNLYGAQCGIVARLKVNGDRVYSMEYRIKFDRGFDWRLGGKLPGLAGGTGPSGGGKPTDGQGFSTRYMWRENGRLVVYAYYRDQPNYYGQDWDCNFTFQTDRWYTLKQRVTVNTGNNANGRVEVWVDGTKKLDRRNVRLMTVNNTVDEVSFDTFMGGNTPSWSPNHTQYLRIDDVKVVKGGGITSVGTGNVTVRARGTSGSEQIEVRYQNRRVGQRITLGTSFREYKVQVNNPNGNFKVAFVNDNGSRDAEVDWLRVGTNKRQAENRRINTAVWHNNSCGGQNSQRMDCNGYIDFGTMSSSNARTAESTDKVVSPAPTDSPFRTYPNPASGQLTVVGSQDYQVALYDLSGRAVMQHQHLKARAQLDIHHLRPGVYVVKMSDAQHAQWQERIVVE